MKAKARVVVLHVIFLPLLIVGSWFLTMMLYGVLTNFGERTTLGFLAFTKPDHIRLTYRQFVFDVDRSVEFGACRIEVMNADSTPVWTVTSQLDGGGVSARIRVSRSLVDDPDNFDRDHFISIVSLGRPGPSWLFRYNRDIIFDRPIGPLRAEIKAYAADLSNQKNSGLSREDSKLVAARTAEIIDSCHGISTWAEKFPVIRMISGPIQEMILILCMFSILLIAFETVLATFRLTRGETAIESAEVFVDLVPYVGFFGTIYGMAGALWYLGGIDLSDPIEKATKIGPITGNISLAMEASQLGILFFLAASLVLRAVRVAMREPT